jgi:hypothetical protein
VITLGAIEFGRLLSGAVLTEQIFAIPGFGKLLVDGVFNRDYAVVQGVVLVSATLFVLLNLLADVLYFVAKSSITRMKRDHPRMRRPVAPARRDGGPRDRRLVHRDRARGPGHRAVRPERHRLPRRPQGAVAGPSSRHRRGRP